MIIEEIILKKISPKKGFLLTNGEITTDALFVSEVPADDVWWEIPNEDYAPEYDGMDFLYPITWENGMKVTHGLWYTDGENTWEAIANGIPSDFNDANYFDIVA